MVYSCENGQLKVILSDSETIKYNIDLVFFDKGSKGADKALAGLFKLAQKETGFKTDANRLLIEIYPIFSGGCEVYYIPDKERPRETIKAVKKAKNIKHVVCKFANSNHMLSAAEALYMSKNTRYIECALYEYKGQLRFVISDVVKQFGETASVLDFCEEITDSGVEYAKTKEYGKLLSRDVSFDIGRVMSRTKKCQD